VNVCHVASVAEGLSVGPLRLGKTALRAEDVSQVPIGCNKLRLQAWSCDSEHTHIHKMQIYISTCIREKPKQTTRITQKALGWNPRGISAHGLWIAQTRGELAGAAAYITSKEDEISNISLVSLRLFCLLPVSLFATKSESCIRLKPNRGQ